MSAWSQTLEFLKGVGLGRGAIRLMYGKSRRIDRSRGSLANRFPQNHRQKRKRLQRIQKRSRQANRNA